MRTDPYTTALWLGIVLAFVAVVLVAIDHRETRKRRAEARARDVARHRANRVPANELALFGEDWRDPVRPYARTRHDRDRLFAHLVGLADEFRSTCR